MHALPFPVIPSLLSFLTSLQAPVISANMQLSSSRDLFLLLLSEIIPAACSAPTYVDIIGDLELLIDVKLW